MSLIRQLSKKFDNLSLKVAAGKSVCEIFFATPFILKIMKCPQKLDKDSSVSCFGNLSKIEVKHLLFIARVRLVIHFDLLFSIVEKHSAKPTNYVDILGKSMII